MPLSANDRHRLNLNLPLLPLTATDTQGNRIRKAADLLFPYLAIEDGLFVSAHTAALTVDVTGGFVRDANGNILEVKQQNGYGAFTAPVTVGQSRVYGVSYDPVGLAFVTTAGAPATTGTQVAPGFPVNQIPVATVTVANGDTATADTKISNLVRAFN